MLSLPRGVVVATIATTATGAAVLAAFLVSTVIVNVDVSENIVLDSPAIVEIALFPSETREVEVLLRNIGSADQAASVVAELVGEGNGLIVTSPGLVVVPADGLQHPFVVSIAAASDIEPALHTVAIAIERE